MSRTFNVFEGLIERMGGIPDSEKECTPEDVYKTHRLMEDLAWRRAVYFVLRECFTSVSDVSILSSKLAQVDFSSYERKEKIREIIKELHGE